jgi:hypothetical protein
MAKTEPIPISASFPVGGVHKGSGLQGQPENTTASALNVWPQDWGGGRARGGSRPGTASITGWAGGIPLNWVPANWLVSSANHSGILVLGRTKLMTIEPATGASSPSEATTLTTTNLIEVASDAFSSCAMYEQRAYRADSTDANIDVYDLTATDSPQKNDLTTLTTASAKGTAPTYCGLVCSYGDRLVLSGDANSPQAIYMSRIGDHADWDFTKTDGSAAWANAGSVPGKIGERVTTLYEHNRNCLLVGCADSLYVIRGNPGAGTASVELLSREVAPIMQSAICKTGSEHAVMMTRHGLYRMDPGCGSPPINMSDEKLPDNLSDIDPKTDTVSLAYDAKFRGVHILIVRGSTADAYFYSLMYDSFWPMDYSAGGPFILAASLNSWANDTRSPVLFLKSGASYEMDESKNESFTSRCLFGPFAMGAPQTEGTLTELSSVLATGSNDATWELYAGLSPQEAFDAAEAGSSPSFTGDNWSTGLNYMQHPRARGTVCYVLVETTTDKRWSLEELFGVAYSNARRRVR